MNLLETAKRIGVEGFLHPAEMEKLAELAENRDVLEIGSFKGLSAWAMCITANSFYSVDTHRANSAGQQQMNELTTYKDFLSATRRYNIVESFVGSSEAAELAIDTNRTFDMIFLDALHTYEDVKADVERWWPRVRTHGIFAMHDYGHTDFKGVAIAADEIFGPAAPGTTIGTLRWIQKP